MNRLCNRGAAQPVFYIQAIQFGTWNYIGVIIRKNSEMNTIQKSVSLLPVVGVVDGFGVDVKLSV
jgi:hypothetical protein